MSLTTRVGLLAGAAALTLSGISNARPAGETSNDDTAQRLAAAEAKIAAMEAAQNQNWMTEQRATEIRGLVQDVLADADTRASLLQTGMTAGYDNGAVISSSDGNWLVRTNILLQQRFVYNNADDGGNDGFNSSEYGFETTRAEFILSGHVVDPTWYYNVRVNVGSEDQSGLIFGYVGKDFGNGLSVQMGAMQSQVAREDIVTPENQMAIERSTVVYGFSPGYINGVQVAWASDKFRVFGQVSNGSNSGQDTWQSNDVKYAISGRGEFLFSGNWDQFKDFTSPRGSEGGMMLGAAAYYQSGEDNGPIEDIDSFLITADFSWEANGWNIFASGSWSDTDAVDNNPYGVVVQGGYYLNDTWELYGRLEWTNYDIDDVDDLGIVTVGVNKYFAGANNKMSGDFGYAWNTLPVSVPLTGVRTDVQADGGQFIVRFQWQLMF